MRKWIFWFIGVVFVWFPALAQEDLSSLLESMGEEETNYASAGFKTTRVINSHSFENVAGGVLDVKISHRFGFINGGAYELFGLDNASIRIGADYGITDQLMIGLGRSSFEKTYDGFIKYKFFRQSTGKRNMPISAAIVSTIALKTIKSDDPEQYAYFSSRIFYTHQLIIGRKFNEKFSFQLMPALVHRNIVETVDQPHDIFAIGAAARQKITKRIALNAEYYYVINQPDPAAHNSLSLGFDIETGGHVFQLHFTNSTSMIEKGFITETTGDWLNGDIHFGFNISRVFTIRHKINSH